MAGLHGSRGDALSGPMRFSYPTVEGSRPGILAHRVTARRCRFTAEIGDGAGEDGSVAYIGGVTFRPTFTRGVSRLPSGCFVAALTKMLAPAFSSLFSPGT